MEIIDTISGTSLKTCNCNPTSIEFIKAEFNGINICFEEKWCPGILYNFHVLNDTAHYDLLNLSRENSKINYEANLIVSYSGFYKSTLPFVMDSMTSTYGQAQLSLLDRDPATNSCYFCPSDSVNFEGVSHRALKFSISDTSNGYIKGSFEGDISTLTNKHLQVKKGLFNIKITRVAKL